jgi:3-dehydroquinate synthase
VIATPTDRRAAGSEGAAGRHVALVGFMGAGKTSVGRGVAQRTGMAFVDLDELIADSTGKSIPEIFRDHGEVGFRARERAMLREILSRPAPHVIATGGGTFVDPTMREWMQESSRTIYLQADAEVLFRRLGEMQRQERPLLHGPDPRETVRRLLAERTPAYEQCDLTVHTDEARVEEVVDQIVHQLRLERQRTGPTLPSPRTRASGNVAASGALGRDAGPQTATRPVEVVSHVGTYQVQMRAEAGAWLADEIARVCPGTQVAVISDRTVGPLHAEPIARDLRQRGKSVSVLTVPPGDATKTLETAGRLYDELIASGLDRAGAVVSVGGGMVGDLAGFVAATLYRGVSYVQVPTTTLGAVDASIGGKNAVNTPRGKNLVGTIHPPAAVLVAVAHLATQPRREHAAGLAEALKMAATLDGALFDALVHDATKLLSFEAEPLLLAMRRAVALKAEVVALDEHENADRVVLNYGHTIGHAIEVGERFQLLHGEAVALGMVAEAEWAQAEGISSEVCSQLKVGLQALGLRGDWRKTAVDADAIGVDKKRVGGNIRLPIVPSLGSFEIRNLPVAALVGYVRSRSST